ncbi:ketoacyl-ACP synthase III [Paenibacillus sp. MBLB4367]|uniref:ketoacyl-ACP synthase III n=1 Tax=Paenibacillus sp. MBLB4367 TaxID=3384767 RepID=UPI003907FC8A
MTAHAKITAIGSYVPDRLLTNADLENMIDTTDEWIVQRTGIRERRIAAADQFTSDLCAAAVERLMETSGKAVDDVDMIIVATHTPDFPFPSVSAMLQAKFGIRSAGAVDLNATCAGFTYGVHLAGGLIASGLHRKVLVVGADTMSKITDYTDRTTCILFGDGAGAVLVERDEEQPSFLAAHMGTDGSGGIHVYRTGLSSTMNGVPLVDTKCFVQNGREVYKWAVSTVTEGIRTITAKAGLSPSDIDWLVPHSANMRIIESICEKTGIPLEKSLHSLVTCGNTSAASIPLALDLGVRDGKVKKGDLVLLYGFGGGLTHAGLLLRWGI